MRSSKAATPIRSAISGCTPRATRPWCARSCRRPRTSRRSASTAKRRSCRAFTTPACSPAPLPNGSRRYQLRARFGDNVVELDDPYRFPPILTDFDLYLLGEGTHQQLYDKLGAHPMTLDGVDGVAFVVLAPNARRVSVVGDFNFWDGAAPRRCACAASATGRLFVPGARAGRPLQIRDHRPAGPACCR